MANNAVFLGILGDDRVVCFRYNNDINEEVCKIINDEFTNAANLDGFKTKDAFMSSRAYSFLKSLF